MFIGKSKAMLMFFMVLMLAVAMVFAAGCDDADEPVEDVEEVDEVNEVEEVDEDEEEAAPVEPEYEWRFGAYFSTDHHLTQGALKFAEEMDRLTDGRVLVDVYPDMQLGTGEEMLEGVQLGSIDLCEATLTAVTEWDDTFFFLNLPFLFHEPEVAYAFLDGPMGRDLLGEVGDTNIRVIAFWENGFRNITSNIGPIVEPEDIVGQDIRLMPNPVHMDGFSQVNANPTPMAFGELFTALQQGVIDGQENPLANIYDMSFHEVQDYLTVSGHYYDVTGFYITESLYQSLPGDIQDAVDEAAIAATKYHRGLAREADERLLDYYLESDHFVEVNVLTPEQKARWQEAMAGTYDNFRDQIGADFLEEVLEEVESLHQQFYDGELDTSDLY